MDTEHKPLPPNNYLALSIITTLLCCQVFGIIAIVYAAQVNTKYIAGDYIGAEKASKNAKTWSLVGLGLGFLIIAMGLIFYGAVIFAAIANREF